jgi:hypothetical protein
MTKKGEQERDEQEKGKGCKNAKNLVVKSEDRSISRKQGERKDCAILGMRKVDRRMKRK